MEWKVGDLVTRKSHQNDMVFKILGIEGEICYLKGLNIRLCADSPLSDLEKHHEEDDVEKERDFYGNYDYESIYRGLEVRE